MPWPGPPDPAAAARAGDERGAIAVLIAVLIGGGVLTGMGALVIDVGQLYAERAQLQNGADAGALAVAKSCAAGTCTPAIATAYADANAEDGASAVSLVCGSGSLGPARPAPARSPTARRRPPARTTSTCTPPPRHADGSTLLPPSFARALPGDGGYNGTTVGACAQAQWGPPPTATTTGGDDLGLRVGPRRPAWEPCSRRRRLTRRTRARAVGSIRCSSSRTSTGQRLPERAAGADGPGVFGWTDDQTGACTVDINSAAYGDNTEASAGQSCAPALAAAAPAAPRSTSRFTSRSPAPAPTLSTP